MIDQTLEKRVRLLKKGDCGKGPVVYLMARDMRVEDNWALLYAKECALHRKVPLIVCFHIAGSFGEGALRQYAFMVEGLREVEEACRAKNIAFVLTKGSWGNEVAALVREVDASSLVCDFSPLKEVRQWWKEVLQSVDVPVVEVDAHNVVPAWYASDKEEYAARTFRPKIHRLLNEFLIQYPLLKKHPYSLNKKTPKIDWKKVLSHRTFKHDVRRVDQFTPGSKAAQKRLKTFIAEELAGYSTRRNDPNANATSLLSPYIRFGHISAARIALVVQEVRAPRKDKEAYLEELIVRRELAENFCLYQKQYDSLKGIRPWARETLKKHRSDKREYIYDLSIFEEAKTHDPLWNAAQMEMAKTGHMHGYMRMYWAKKIFEWTTTPEEACAIAITLNDRYELDGRDPNGYVGVLWSIGGIHDRAWTERPVFGKIRYMNYNGCKRKFNVDTYIAMHGKGALFE